jgi:hypothetical protein
VSEACARAELEAAVERDEADLQRAIDDLKDAVQKPFEIGERIAAWSIPVILGGLLFGIWLGSRD